jgi:hypothetical protein
MAVLRSRANALLFFGVVASAISFPASARADDDEPSTPPATHTVPARALVRVHVSAPKTVTLQRREGGRGDWVDACDSPCDEDLALADTYRVVYDRTAAAGEPFRLAPKAGEASVDVKVAPPSRVGGTVLMAIGGAVGVTGLVGTIGAAVLIASSPSASECAAQPQTDANRLCGLGRGLGILVLVPSLLILAAGVALTVVGANVRSDAAPSTTQGLFVRQPTWVLPNVATLEKPAFMVPLRFSF